MKPPEAQNIYDQPEFFEGYRQFPRQVLGFEGAPEWPTMESLARPNQGARVLDLACGFGWFSRWAAEQGAASVLGIDLSQNMLTRAEEMTDNAAVVYRRADLDTWEADGQTYDLIHSSMAFHYVYDLGRLFSEIASALAPGGTLVFSMEHPIFTASTFQQWIPLEGGQIVWPVSGYLDEGQRVTKWIVDGVVKYHRTEGTILNLLIDNGFQLKRVIDFGPTKGQIAAQPAWNAERERPAFLIVSANLTQTPSASGQ